MNDVKKTVQFSPDAMAEHAEEASQLMRVLANPNRLLILCILSKGEATVSELNAAVGLSQSALSQHLSVLRHDGLVDTRRESQNIYYRLADGPAVDVIHTLHNLYCG